MNNADPVGYTSHRENFCVFSVVGLEYRSFCKFIKA
jgi:hypothetical protein